MLPKAVLFTRWMAKFLHNEVTANNNDNSRKGLVVIQSITVSLTASFDLSIGGNIFRSFETDL